MSAPDNSWMSAYRQRFRVHAQWLIRSRKQVCVAAWMVLVLCGMGLLWRDIHQIRRQVWIIYLDVSSIEWDVSDIQGDVSSIQSDVSSIGADVSSIQSDVSSIQSDVSDIQPDIRKMRRGY